MKTDLICIVCSKHYQSFNPNGKHCSEKCRKERERKMAGREAWSDTMAPGTVGALSEMLVAADMMKKGYSVFRALSPSCFCDLIATKDSKMLKIEVRTGYASVSGKINFTRKAHGVIDYFGVSVLALSKVIYYDANLKQTEEV